MKMPRESINNKPKARRQNAQSRPRKDTPVKSMMDTPSEGIKPFT